MAQLDIWYQVQISASAKRSQLLRESLDSNEILVACQFYSLNEHQWYLVKSEMMCQPHWRPFIAYSYFIVVLISNGGQCSPLTNATGVSHHHPGFVLLEGSAIKGRKHAAPS